MKDKELEAALDEKFIVINTKRFEEMAAIERGGYFGCADGILLRQAITKFVQAYEHTTGKKMDQKYLVCNQDEPYADEVARIILGKPHRHLTLEEFKQKYEEELQQPEKIITDFMEKLGDWLSEMIKIAFVEGYHAPGKYLTLAEWEAKYREPLRHDAMVWAMFDEEDAHWKLMAYHDAVDGFLTNDCKILIPNGPYPPPEDYHADTTGE
jgi:hypothetical protein